MVGSHRGLPHQHASTAQGPVQRVNQLDHSSQLLLVSHPERRRRHDGHAFVGSILQLADQAVGRAGIGQQLEPTLHLSVDHHLTGRPQERLDLADHQRRLLPGPTQGCRRDDRGRNEGHGAANEGVGPPGQAGPRVGNQRAHHDRLDSSLGDEQLSPVEQERGGHGETHNQRELPPSRAELEDQQVSQQHADGDADRDLEHPPQALAVGRTETHHGRDRSKERGRMAQQVSGDQPRGAGGQRALDDLPALGLPPSHPRPGRRPTAEPHAVQRSRLHVSDPARARRESAAGNPPSSGAAVISQRRVPSRARS